MQEYAFDVLVNALNYTIFAVFSFSLIKILIHYQTAAEKRRKYYEKHPHK